MIPMNVNPDVPHKSDYSCCEIVQDAVASAAADGRVLDDDWVATLHQVVMGERTVEEVVDELVRRNRGRG